MKSTGGLLGQMVSRENLAHAAWLAAKGRRDRPVVQHFLARLDEELAALAAELSAGQPRCGECHTFTIHDPKTRRITAPVFRERVLHHAVMNICAPVLDRRLMFHCYACRTGKGTFAALAAAQQAAAGHAWFVKLDVRQYFASIPRTLLLERVCRVFRERRVQDIFTALVHAYDPGQERGLPIGTLVSQHLANYYLSPLDTFILQDVRPGAYVRYMDDFALWTTGQTEARSAAVRVRQFAAETLRLELKPESIHRTARGMDFLGHSVFPHRTGLNRASRVRFQRKLRALHTAWESGAMPEREAQDRATALVSFTAHAACLGWRRRAVEAAAAGPPA